ncbi:classical arabinogalactan protein 9 [Heracleum sosnowskyi]|uniref:Classical arabinogalactan protein 9 n=1 Tax=Heracleum sosnowskyi TaxID=360622 RepID=A0AAD8IDN2_9APIA|nr:classical arabinogalactan protein 9 [Heracleum sosnowskyi]
MSRVCYFILLIMLIFQDFTILCATSPVQAPTYAPAYTPTYSPAYTPTIAPAYTPTLAPTLPPMPMPKPSSPSPSHHNNADSPPTPPSSPPSAKSKGSSKGMNGGQKAGLALGVIAGAALVGFGGMVYAKRRKNIRRSRFIDSVQLTTPFRRVSP